MKSIWDEVLVEIGKGRAKYGPMRHVADGYSRLLCEVIEFQHAHKPEDERMELVQVLAMSLRFITEVLRSKEDASIVMEQEIELCERCARIVLVTPSQYFNNGLMEEIGDLHKHVSMRLSSFYRARPGDFHALLAHYARNFMRRAAGYLYWLNDIENLPANEIAKVDLFGMPVPEDEAERICGGSENDSCS